MEIDGDPNDVGVTIGTLDSIVSIFNIIPIQCKWQLPINCPFEKQRHQLNEASQNTHLMNTWKDVIWKYVKYESWTSKYNYYTTH